MSAPQPDPGVRVEPVEGVKGAQGSVVPISMVGTEPGGAQWSPMLFFQREPSGWPPGAELCPFSAEPRGACALCPGAWPSRNPACTPSHNPVAECVPVSWRLGKAPRHSSPALFEGPQKPAPEPPVPARSSSSFRSSRLWRRPIWLEQENMSFSISFQTLKKSDQGEWLPGQGPCGAAGRVSAWHRWLFGDAARAERRLGRFSAPAVPIPGLP